MTPRIKRLMLTGVLVIASLSMSILPAIPAAAAAPNLTWTAIETPGLEHGQMTVGNGSWTMDVAPDGKTIFAYDNVGLKLHKSIDGGLTWTTSGIGTFYTDLGAIIAPSNHPHAVGLAVSPDYAADTTVILADDTYVYRSTDGGATFTRLSSPNVGVIKSFDIGPFYTGEKAILVGGSTGAAIMSASAFIPVDFDPTAAGAQGTSVLAVALPPNHEISNEIVFVTADGEGVYVRSKYGDHAVGADQTPALITGASTFPVSGASRATIAFPADYSSGDYRTLFVGLGDNDGVSAAAQDVYQVTYGPPIEPSSYDSRDLIAPQSVGDTAEVADMNVKGFGTSTNVYSLSFRGNIYDGRLFVGQKNSRIVYWARGLGSFGEFIPSFQVGEFSRVTIFNGQATAAPHERAFLAQYSPTSRGYISVSGTASAGDTTIVVEVKDITDKYLLGISMYVLGSSNPAIPFESNRLIRVYTSTLSGNSTEVALSVAFNVEPASTETIVMASPVASDNAVYAITSGEGSAFAISPDNGAHFLNASLIGLATPELSVVDMAVTGDNTIFLIQKDLSGRSWLFKSSDNGATWTNIADIFIVGLSRVYPSSYYAQDGIVFALTEDGRAWRIADQGATFAWIGEPYPSSILSFLTFNGDNYLAGTTSGLFKKGWFSPGSGTTGTITSIARSDVVNLFVGTSTGQVFFSTNDGISFIEVKPGVAPFPSGDVDVATDANYATNRIIYAAGAQGIKRINADPGAGTTWTTIFDVPVKSLVKSPYGTLYALAANGSAVYRCVDPTDPSPSWETVTGSTLPGWPGGATTATRIKVIPTMSPEGPINTLYAIADAPGEDSVLVFRDTLITAPALLSPANNGRGRGTLSWSAASNPTQVTYRYQVARDAGFTDLVISSTTTSTNATLSGLTEGSRYYWRVSVEKGLPLASPLSAVRSFTFTTAPSARGDANDDGLVNMGDVTRTELIILGMAETNDGADANGDGLVNMGDVTRTELIILGLVQ